MRHIHILFGSSLFACLLAFSGCSTDELPGTEPTDGTATPFTITVTDDGYASPDAAPHTRAAENDYTTTFTAGDQIGVFAVKNNAIVNEISNLCFTAEAGSGGNDIVWKNSNTTLQLPANATYYAYYPYRQTLTSNLVPTASDAAGFFANVISNWTPVTDQSTYEKYTAQDLMIAKGTVNNKSLSFSMAHQMALVVISLPGTKYVFNNSPAIPDYIINGITDTKFTDFAPYCMSYGTYRYLVKTSASGNLSGSYTDSGTKTWNFSLSSVSAGNYKVFQVDGGVKEIPHTLQAGDFYLSDGSLVGKETSLSSEQKAACLGIVFYVGNIKGDNYGLLDSKFPHGTHGLVVSLWEMPAPDNASSTTMTWTYGGYEYVSDWLKNATWSSGSRPSSFTSIQETEKMQGYANTLALLEYNKYVESQSGDGYGSDGNKRVKPVKSLAAFQSAHPAPECSSGWYWPSACELRQVCRGQGVTNQGTNGKTMLNTQIQKVGGTTFGDDKYWSSTEASGNYRAWYVVFDYGNVDSYGFKYYDTYRVRPLFAF